MTDGRWNRWKTYVSSRSSLFAPVNGKWRMTKTTCGFFTSTTINERQCTCINDIPVCLSGLAPESKRMMIPSGKVYTHSRACIYVNALSYRGFRMHAEICTNDVRDLWDKEDLCAIAIYDKIRTTVFDLPVILYSASLNSGNSRKNSIIARFTRSSGNRVNKNTWIHRKAKIKIHALKGLFKLRILMERNICRNKDR